MNIDQQQQFWAQDDVSSFLQPPESTTSHANNPPALYYNSFQHVVPHQQFVYHGATNINTHALNSGMNSRSSSISPKHSIDGLHTTALNSFEAYSKNDPNGCTSGVIASFSTKPETSQSRKRITPQQTAILEDGFKQYPKPDKEFREELSKRTGLPQRNIQVCAFY